MELLSFSRSCQNEKRTMGTSLSSTTREARIPFWKKGLLLKLAQFTTDSSMQCNRTTQMKWQSKRMENNYVRSADLNSREILHICPKPCTNMTKRQPHTHRVALLCKTIKTKPTSISCTSLTMYDKWASSALL